MSQQPVLRKSHLLWIFAYPIYQAMGTIRHEASHALAAVLQGGRIEEFVFFPSIHEKMGFVWGYVRWVGSTDWVVRAAPYFCDLLTFIFFFLLCLLVIFRWRWMWLNLVILGLASPLINSAYNYLGGLRSDNDVGHLLDVLPPWVVHTYFIVSMLFYLAGIIVTFRFSRSVFKWKSTEKNQV